ncbi:unnamed protein product, partial [Symbiodinium microadriaticum]
DGRDGKGGPKGGRGRGSGKGGGKAMGKDGGHAAGLVEAVAWAAAEAAAAGRAYGTGGKANWPWILGKKECTLRWAFQGHVEGCPANFPWTCETRKRSRGRRLPTPSALRIARDLALHTTQQSPIEWTRTADQHHPHSGRRVGEASHPGPPNERAADTAPEPPSVAVRQRRERALHALAQMRLLLAAPPSPAATPRPAAAEPPRAGDAAPTLSGEATPGFTPPQSPRDSALLQSSNVPPGTIARLMRAAAECESLDADAPVPDIARALDQLSALPPEAPLPLSAAVLLTMTADGYLAAPAQSALLEAYGGGALAAAVQTLADEARDHFTPIAPRQGQANDRQNGRRRSSQRRRRARRSREHTASADDPADSGAVPTCPRPAAVEAEAAWEPLDGVDLQDELRHPVPTLQDVPPFLRAAVRGALVKALAHLHAALVA